jgi:drug/metabolite transporter (DMT)-like permease
MSKDKYFIAIILAILAAALYAISTPVSKVMLQTVAPTMVAAFLYLGAGIGMGAMMLVRSGRHRTTEERLLAVERLRYTSLNYDLCILEFIARTCQLFSFLFYM